MNKIVSNDVKTNTILKVNVIEKKKLNMKVNPTIFFEKKKSLIKNRTNLHGNQHVLSLIRSLAGKCSSKLSSCYHIIT